MEADRRPIVRRSICGSRSCNRVPRTDTLAALVRRPVTVAETEAATPRRIMAGGTEAAMLPQATAAVADIQHHRAVGVITAHPVTVVAVAAAVAATVRPVAVTGAATALRAAMVADIPAVGVVDTPPEAAEAAAIHPAAVVVIPPEATGITKESLSWLLIKG